MLWIALFIFLAVIAFLYIVTGFGGPRPVKLGGSHVLITGGSSGIGKCLAIEAVKGGANVTLMARNQVRLHEAKQEIEKWCRDGQKQSIKCVSVDVSKDYNVLEESIRKAEEMQGPVNILVNCAGISSSARFVDTTLEEFYNLMEVNYHGSVRVTRAVLPSLLKQKGGRIVFVSSMAGQLGLFGYTAYSASKFALRGLAESLQMELKPYNIQVTLAFPPDTDTPGFAEEQKMKPRETKLISESGGMFKPDVVAKQVIADMLKGSFTSSLGLDGYMLTTVTAGFSPVTSALSAAQQVFLMGLFRLVSLFYLCQFDSIVKKCHLEDEAQTVRGDGDKKSS